MVAYVNNLAVGEFTMVETSEVSEDFGSPGLGEFMRRRVFVPGRTLSWNELTKHATGAGLNAKGFAADFEAK